MSQILTTNVTDVSFRKRNKKFNENIALHRSYSFQLSR